MLKKYIVERVMPGVGECSSGEFGQLAEKSERGIDELGTMIQWHESYVTENKIYCVYLAESEEVIKKHAFITGLPLDSISEIKRTLDPSNATLADLPYTPHDDASDNFTI